MVLEIKILNVVMVTHSGPEITQNGTKLFYMTRLIVSIITKTTINVYIYTFFLSYFHTNISFIRKQKLVYRKFWPILHCQFALHILNLQILNFEISTAVFLRLRGEFWASGMISLDLK
jgi:hypothetical protein